MNESAPKKKGVHLALKIWFFFHVFMMIAWSMPLSDPAVRSGTVPAKGLDQVWITNDKLVRESFLSNYTVRTGLWQYWDMFAPNPLSVDYYVDGVIQFADGSVSEGNFPRIAKLPMWEKMGFERYRKFTERLHSRENQFLWPAAAYRLALQNAKDSRNPPVKVTLLLHMRKVGPPGKDPDVDKYIPEALYVLVVDQQRLALDKGWSLQR